MTGDREGRVPRRITVALTRREQPPALEALLRHLGAGTGAEVRALFIEDADVLKAAALPFTVEFCALTNTRRPIDQAAVEAHFRREAAATERRLAQLAAAGGYRLQFEIVRERGRLAMISALAQSDLTLVARRATRPATQVAAVLAILDAAPAAARTLEVAQQVAHAEGAPLLVYRVADDARDDNETIISRDELVPLLQRAEARLAVLPVTLVDAVDETAGELSAAAGAPLLLVR